MLFFGRSFPVTKVIIGTRGSSLALAQSEEIRRHLEKLFPKVTFTLKQIRTGGDKSDVVLPPHAATVGFFTKELEEALLAKEIDIAVHSLKDLPTKSPETLEIAAITVRENPQDGLVTDDGRSLSALRPGARIGTGSERRRTQLLHWNRSFEVVGIRGNLDTRLRKLKEGNFDAIVLALAGLKRYGADPKKIWPIPFEVMLPAPGQGALAVQIRRGEERVKDLVSRLEDPESRRSVTAERAFLSRLGGGCQLPLGALAVVKEGSEILLKGVLMSGDGRREIRTELRAAGEPSEVGEKLGEKFFEMGAKDLLNEKG